jgi:hypothetical protein
MVREKVVDPDPGRSGTVTLQDVWVGHLVGAGWFPKRAKTRPFGLKKPDPCTTRTLPAPPSEGVTDESCGVAVATGVVVDVATGKVVVVVVVVLAATVVEGSVEVLGDELAGGLLTTGKLVPFVPAVGRGGPELPPSPTATITTASRAASATTTMERPVNRIGIE